MGGGEVQTGDSEGEVTSVSMSESAGTFDPTLLGSVDGKVLGSSLGRMLGLSLGTIDGKSLGKMLG